MKIKLTADTRVLLSAGTIVDVSKETAAVILRLGRCELLDEKAEKQAEKVEEAEEVPEKAEPKKKPVKKPTPRKTTKKKD